MPTKISYQVKKGSNAAPNKSCRIIKKAAAMPLKGTLVVKGTSADNRIKTFRFSVLTAAQQLKERNSAYHFFSID